MAIKLEYNSCLFEEAFDTAVLNYIDVNNTKKELEQEQKEWRDNQEEIKKEKLQAGEFYEIDEKEWPTYNYAKFKTKKEQFVVCLNTLGQDRDFTDDEKRFALKTVQHFKETWEQIEEENLRKDVVWKIEANEYDKLYKEHFLIQDEAEIDKNIEEEV